MNKILDINKFIVASDNPNILKVTSLQLGKFFNNKFNNSSLLIIFKFSVEHPENSEKILFSIPK